ncbi:MAG: tRNA (adenosine(37)-N6)-threonylcarbamoyltransferase complex ATPase subunit type 1 TsaE [Bacteroidetes bacterium]|nr:tRNA (adenosine(37)-N6)-threonylcarbamoyltransferase complex ATPase subunit type 1 TsaE [Bacteroidota bacterium]
MEVLLNNYNFTLETLSEAAEKILSLSGDNRIFLFEAPMGSGKTTLIKELCKSLGSKDNFSSPTYSIINEYTSPKGKILHMDLYRIKDLEELLDLGFDEQVDSASYVFIEWPGLAASYLQDNFVQISVKTEGNIRYLHATQF